MIDLHNVIDPEESVDSDLVGAEGEVLLKKSISEEIVSLCKFYQTLYKEITTLRQSLGLEEKDEKEEEEEDAEEYIYDDDDYDDQPGEEDVLDSPRKGEDDSEIDDLKEGIVVEVENEDDEVAEFEVAGTVITEDEEVVQHWGDLIKLGIFRGSVDDTGDGKYVLKHDVLPPSMDWLAADKNTFFKKNNEFYRRNSNAFDSVPNPYPQWRRGDEGKDNYIPKEVFLDESGRAMRFFLENRWKEFENQDYDPDRMVRLVGSPT